MLCMWYKLAHLTLVKIIHQLKVLYFASSIEVNWHFSRKGQIKNLISPTWLQEYNSNGFVLDIPVDKHLRQNVILEDNLLPVCKRERQLKYLHLNLSYCRHFKVHFSNNRTMTELIKKKKKTLQTWKLYNICIMYVTYIICLCQLLSFLR